VTTVHCHNYSLKRNSIYIEFENKNCKNDSRQLGLYNTNHLSVAFHLQS